MTEDEVKQISQIQAQLVSPLNETLELKAGSALLTAWLERKKKKPLIYVMESLGLSIPPNKCSTKLEYAQTLTSWVLRLFVMTNSRTIFTFITHFHLVIIFLLIHLSHLS